MCAMIIHLIVYTCNQQRLQSDIVSLSVSLNKKFDFITRQQKCDGLRCRLDCLCARGLHPLKCVKWRLYNINCYILSVNTPKENYAGEETTGMPSSTTAMTFCLIFLFISLYFSLWTKKLINTFPSLCLIKLIYLVLVKEYDIMDGLAYQIVEHCSR